MAKERLCVTIEKELIEWIDKQANTIRFRNRSHVVEYAIAKLKQEEESKNEHEKEKVAENERNEEIKGTFQEI